MQLMLLTSLLALLVNCVQVLGDDYCFDTDAERVQIRQFGTRTAYQFVKGTNIDEEYQVPGCEPKKMWIFQRHGTRLPSAKTIKIAPRLEELRDLIYQNYMVLKTQPKTNALCASDLKAINTWQWNNSITTSMDEYLTSQGYDDLSGTAKFYQRYYPTVLPNKYNNTYYLFRHTDTQRTTESFKSFANGLFGDSKTVQAAEIPKKDLLLRPYEFCKFESKNWKGVGSEYKKFYATELWNKTMSDIATRLGFKTLDWKTIELMFDMCRYEQSWNLDRTSAWCAAFLPEQVRVMEYVEDLKSYYGAGYGFEENKRLHCRAVQDIVNRLSSPVSPHVVAYFGHSPGFQYLLMALGINKDDKRPTADNYDSMDTRSWRTSQLGPFAANLAVVKYDCPKDPNKEKVLFFLNQKIVQLAWCHVGVCNWSDFLEKFQTISQANCEEYFCPS